MFHGSVPKNVGSDTRRNPQGSEEHHGEARWWPQQLGHCGAINNLQLLKRCNILRGTSQLEQTGLLAHGRSSALHKSFCLEGALSTYGNLEIPRLERKRSSSKGLEGGWGKQLPSTWRWAAGRGAQPGHRPQKCHCSRMGPHAGSSQLTACHPVSKSALISVKALERSYKNS